MPLTSLRPFLLIPLTIGGCVTYSSHPLTSSTVDQALTSPSSELLRRQAWDLEHPILRPLALDPRQPLSPEAAAVMAVLINPVLRADRDRVGVSEAQLIIAGILPNPQLTLSRDFVTSGPGITNPYGIGLTWDFTSLITRAPSARPPGKRSSRFGSISPGASGKLPKRRRRRCLMRWPSMRSYGRPKRWINA